MKNIFYFINPYAKRASKYCLLLFLLAWFLSDAAAQTLTKPKIYFPLTSSDISYTPERLTPSNLGNKTDISLVPLNNLDWNGGILHINDRHDTQNEAVELKNTKRLKMANATGNNRSTSFFGINTATGYDVAKFTISCWVYVTPTETLQRYIFYGADNSSKLGFALSIKGSDLYLSKYLNNAAPEKGLALTPAVVGNTWEAKFYGPSTFTAGSGWYHIILVQADYYTRLFVGNPPELISSTWKGKKGKFGKDFVGSMFMHGKQNLTSFTEWGIGLPGGNTTAQHVRAIDDFMVFDYDMTEAEAEALYNCQVANTTETCLGSGQAYTQDFALIGDYGCDGGISTTPAITNPELYVANMVKSWTPNFIVSVGDDGYNAVSGCGSSYADNVGKYYGTYVGTTRTNNKFFPVMGNHDRDCPTGTPGGPYPPNTYTCSGGQTSYYKCSCLWQSYFPTKNYSSGTNVNTTTGNGRYYTFQQGNIQFFGLNSNMEEPDGNTAISTQATWLKNALAASTATFKVVYMHHPPYASTIANHGGNAVRDIMKTWSFKEWGADIILAGDYHFYERNDTSNLTVIVNGVGGFKGLANAQSIVPGNRVHIENEFGAVRVQSNDNVMYYRFYSIDPSNPNTRGSDRLRDEFWLYKSASDATYLVENPVELARLQAKDEPLRQQALTVYPNPTNGELTLRLQEQAESNATITLFDFSGKLVYTQQAALNKGTQEISLGNLKAKGVAKGVYFLQVVSPQRNSTVKIVMQ